MKNLKKVSKNKTMKKKKILHVNWKKLLKINKN